MINHAYVGATTAPSEDWTDESTYRTSVGSTSKSDGFGGRVASESSMESDQLLVEEECGPDLEAQTESMGPPGSNGPRANLPNPPDDAPGGFSGQNPRRGDDGQVPRASVAPLHRKSTEEKDAQRLK